MFLPTCLFPNIASFSVPPVAFFLIKDEDMKSCIGWEVHLADMFVWLSEE